MSRSWFPCSCLVVFAACGGTQVRAAAPAVAPAVNTSIASATPLVAGATIDGVLPCSGALYFGPVTFSAEGQHIALVSSATSTTGEQVCGGGAFVDRDDVVQGPGGLGCAEGAAPYREHQGYTYAPGAGNSAANPIYLRLSREPASEGCATIRFSLGSIEVP